MDYKDLWLSILHRLAPTIARAKFLTWFQYTAALGLAGPRLTVGVPTDFARAALSDKYALKVLQAAQEINADITELEFVVDSTLSDTDPRTVNLQATFGSATDKKIRRVAGTQEVKVTTAGLRSAKLNPRYTLSNFVPGDENRLAHAASLAVARAPGMTYNPLFIWGGVGLGKTHLLSAIGHEVVVNDPNKVVVYLTAEMFVNAYLDALKTRKSTEFRHRYRDADVLLLDDIQFLDGKEQTQIEFFNVFNALHGAGKQIVVASDRAPAELTGIMDRLRSRLGWGLIAEVEQPSFASRLDILKSKLQERRTVVDPAILELFATELSGSVRDLEGAVTSLLAESDLLGSEPSLAAAHKILRKFTPTSPTDAVETTSELLPPAELIATIAKNYGLTSTELTGTCRRADIAAARAEAMAQMRAQGMGYAAIGAHFGRSHATVIHAIKKVTQA